MNTRGISHTRAGFRNCLENAEYSHRNAYHESAKDWIREAQKVKAAMEESGRQPALDDKDLDRLHSIEWSEGIGHHRFPWRRRPFSGEIIPDLTPEERGS